MNKPPRHVGIIMDRNGEWAKKRLLTRVKGHQAGVATVQKIVKAAAQMNIEVLSLFAFSTENWLRPEDEVSFLMGLLDRYIRTEMQELLENGIKLVISGRLDRIPPATAKIIQEVINKSTANKGMILNIALDYGGRDEITRACRTIAKKVAHGEIRPEEITEDTITTCLFHPELGDIDLLIRTGSVERISNFMLWQLAYTELYFSPVLWPDYSAEDLKEAVNEFSKRERRYGMTDEQIKYQS